MCTCCLKHMQGALLLFKVQRTRAASRCPSMPLLPYCAEQLSLTAVFMAGGVREKPQAPGAQHPLVGQVNSVNCGCACCACCVADTRRRWMASLRSWSCAGSWCVSCRLYRCICRLEAYAQAGLLCRKNSQLVSGLLVRAHAHVLSGRASSSTSQHPRVGRARGH